MMLFKKKKKSTPLYLQLMSKEEHLKIINENIAELKEPDTKETEHIKFYWVLAIFNALVVLAMLFGSGGGAKSLGYLYVWISLLALIFTIKNRLEFYLDRRAIHKTIKKHFKAIDELKNKE